MCTTIMPVSQLEDLPLLASELRELRELANCILNGLGAVLININVVPAHMIPLLRDTQPHS